MGVVVTRVSHSEVIAPTDPRVGTITGRHEDGVIRVRNAVSGFALYGGYVTLSPGRYRAIVWLSPADPVAGSGIIDVCAAGATVSLAQTAFDTRTLPKTNPFIDLSFRLDWQLENVEVRLRAGAGLSLTITGVEIVDLDWACVQTSVRPHRHDQRRRLNILYSAVHIILEYDELRMLTDLGHRVFSFNHAYSQPNAGNILRPSMPQFFHPGDWDRFDREGLSPGFLADFDAIIVSGTPHRVPELLNTVGDMPVIYRSIGQIHPGCEDMLEPFADRITTVRYSERERGLPGILPADEVIYFGKYRSDFTQEWVGGGGILTFHNSYASRFQDSIPNPDIYRRFAAAWPCDLYGIENQEMPSWRGVAPVAEQFELYRKASLYLYVYTVGPSYSLSFIEAMAAGVPILAPSVEFIRDTGFLDYANAHCFTPDRYEIADLLENDPRMLYSSLEDAHTKIGWLRANPDYCRMVSNRQRARFIETFEAGRISAQWDDLLYRLVPVEQADRMVLSAAD